MPVELVCLIYRHAKHTTSAGCYSEFSILGNAVNKQYYINVYDLMQSLVTLM